MKLLINGREVRLPFDVERLDLVGSITPRVIQNDRRLELEFAGGSGGIADGDYGDVTVSGGGTALTIDSEAVTYAKIQNMTTDRLLGRDTAGTGDVEELTVSGGVEFSGAGGIQRSALTGDVTATAGSNATTIANDAVTYAKIQNVSASRLLGRRSGSSGDVEEVQISAGLSISSGALLSASVTGISVNSVASADVDFLDATPAASAGRKNVTWATTGIGPTSVSASVFQGPTAFKVLSASANVTDGTGAQDWFPTNGDWTVTDDRCYLFEGTLRLSKGSGVATDVLVGFAGTATYTVDWEQMGQGLAADTAGNVQVSSLRTTTTQLAVSPSSTATNVWAKVWGVLRVTAAGTFIPQFQFTAAPGGVPQALRGTRFMLTELGADTVTERGTWS